MGEEVVLYVNYMQALGFKEVQASENTNKSGFVQPGINVGANRGFESPSLRHFFYNTQPIKVK